MKTVVQTSLLISVLFSSSIYAAQKYNVELKGEYETWASGIGGESTALLYGLGLAHRQGKLYYGGGFVTGSYDTDSSDSSDLSRLDVDLVAGYQLDAQWSAFAGYRFNQMDYTSKDGNSDFDENTHGLGGGVGYSQRVDAKWIGFASAALSFLSTEVSYKNSNPSNSGTGYSFGVEGGTLYRINQATSTALRVKYQTSELSYDSSGGSWPHSYVRFALSLSHSF